MLSLLLPPKRPFRILLDGTLWNSLGCDKGRSTSVNSSFSSPENLGGSPLLRQSALTFPRFLREPSRLARYFFRDEVRLIFLCVQLSQLPYPPSMFQVDFRDVPVARASASFSLFYKMTISLLRKSPDCSSLRPSDEHRFIVRVLRARRMVAYPLTPLESECRGHSPAG